jgi:hypothetical protein
MIPRTVKAITVAILSLMLAFAVLGPSAARPAPACAASPADPSGPTIPYKGRLAGPTGQPVADGAYGFHFALFDVPDGGSLIWEETQTGVSVRNGSFETALGSVAPLPPTAFAAKERWLQIAVQGPGQAALTVLSPRQMVATDVESPSALSCPHSHFGDAWSGISTSYGLMVDNTSTGDGIRALSGATSSTYGALYAVNVATSGSGRGVYASSSRGTGVYAESTNNDGLEAVTSAPLANNKSAVYAHSTNGNGVWSVSDSRTGVYAASTGVSGTGRYGLEAYAAQNTGAYIHSGHRGATIETTDPASWYGLVVASGGMTVNGGCTGCAASFFAQNQSPTAIEAGTLVTAVGVKVDEATGQPIILVRPATTASDPVVGVSLGMVASPSAPDGRKLPEGASAMSSAATGEYLTVMTSGIARVKVSGAVAIGDGLTAASEGAVPVSVGAPSSVRVLSAPESDGRAWALIGSR